MEITDTGFEGLKLIVPGIFRDHRGYFFESFRQEHLVNQDLQHVFIQDNQSRSTFGVIRGLHFQKDPFAQTKLIRVLEGSIFDVVVDLRNNSSNYGKWYGVEISDANLHQLLIPKGFAHGFSVLSEHATVFYKCDTYYNAESEAGIRFDDPDLQIDWKLDLKSAVISDKDRHLPYLKDL